MGLMNVNGDPYVIEYNVRLGDPEAQAILPRLRSDLMDLFEGIATGTLSERHVDTDDRSCATVVMASEGYPGPYEANKPIVGLGLVQEALVFQAGTAETAEELVTTGGRVLAVTAFGKDIEHAVINCYRNAALIDFQGKYHRSDIGHDLLRKATPKSGTSAAAPIK
jgi:phosphoribosylamine--glycine ligase